MSEKIIRDHRGFVIMTAEELDKQEERDTLSEQS